MRTKLTLESQFILIFLILIFFPINLNSKFWTRTTQQSLAVEKIKILKAIKNSRELLIFQIVLLTYENKISKYINV